MLGEDKRVQLTRLSHPYFSEPVGMKSDNVFTNAVGVLETEYTSHQFLELLLNIEHEFGRERDATIHGYQDRSLDLDILFFGRQEVSSRELIVPHPRIDNRRFVLDPLLEVSFDYRFLYDIYAIDEMQTQLLADIEAGLLEPQEITVGKWDA